jgi:hypothetical protein
MRIVLNEPPPRVVPPLKLRIEYAAQTRVPELDGLAKEISQATHDHPNPAIDPEFQRNKVEKTSLIR